MKKFVYKAICILLCLVMTMVLTPNPTEALSIGHSGSLNPEVSPGDTYSQILEVSINKDDPATDIIIEILGYKESNGDIEPVMANEDTGLYSARTFIQPQQTTLHCQPGETQRTQINVSIPPNTTCGGRYAIIRCSTVPDAKTGTSIASAIVLPMKFTVTGGQLIHTGKIESVAADKAVSGQPIDIYINFTNTGNHHFGMRGHMEICDNTGKVIDMIFIDTTSPIPGSTKQIKAIYIPKENLEPGSYAAKARLKLEDGTLLDEATGSFEVKEPYVPPPAPANVTVKPESASILQTEDGRIAINLPAGAVLGQADLALRSYPPEQLPSPPTGYISGTTAFRVDGLNGLLAKSATLKVQYSSADLEKAANNQANRLVLARWDEASTQWVIADTKVDKQAMSLTAETNQFGLWAVMGAPPSPGINWTIISTIISLILIVFILSVFYQPKRRKKKEQGAG